MAIVLECSTGKCLKFPADWFTFPHQAEPPLGRTVTDKRDNNVIMENRETGKTRNRKTGNRTDGLDVFATANDFTDGARCKRLPGRRI